MRNRLLQCALALLLLVGQAWTAAAASIDVSVEIPDIDIAEYHRPYVAVWLENDARQPVAHLALWLEQEKWHRDLRAWWRRGGSALRLPVDGVSGATRRPGHYRVTTTLELEQGSRYVLNVEAVREVGGRELLRIPFVWRGATFNGSAEGVDELGAVTLIVKEEPTP
tara:strand:- start:10268 stop:10768 length:501 start_codon:yes stop_codon:yes gene_type:complete